MLIRSCAVLFGGALSVLASAALAAPKPVAGKPTAVPAVNTQPAAKPALKAPSAKAKIPARPKKKLASKSKLKSGRAAANASVLETFDRNQIAADHLAGATAKSPLDLLVSYKETIGEGDLETAGVLLRLASGTIPDHALVTSVNDVLGIALNTDDTEILLEIARADRAYAVAQEMGSSGTSLPSPVGSRIHSAHAAVMDAPGTSRIQALSAYKLAMTEKNAEAAALALAAVTRKPPDEAAVAKANALLGIGANLSADRIVAAQAP